MGRGRRRFDIHLALVAVECTGNRRRGISRPPETVRPSRSGAESTVASTVFRTTDGDARVGRADQRRRRGDAWGVARSRSANRVRGSRRSRAA